MFSKEFRQKNVHLAKFPYFIMYKMKILLKIQIINIIRV